MNGQHLIGETAVRLMDALDNAPDDAGIAMVQITAFIDWPSLDEGWVWAELKVDPEHEGEIAWSTDKTRRAREQTAPPWETSA